MSKADTLYPPLDNTVEIQFTWSGEFATDGLDNFTNITLKLQGDTQTYSTQGTPGQLVKVSNTRLSLRIGDSTTLPTGEYQADIIGFNNTNYNDGFLLTGIDNARLSSIQIKRQD